MRCNTPLAHGKTWGILILEDAAGSFEEFKKLRKNWFPLNAKGSNNDAFPFFVRASCSVR